MKKYFAIILGVILFASLIQMAFGEGLTMTVESKTPSLNGTQSIPYFVNQALYRLPFCSPVASIRSATEVASNPRSQNAVMAASSASSMSNSLGRAICSSCSAPMYTRLGTDRSTIVRPFSPRTARVDRTAYRCGGYDG